MAIRQRTWLGLLLAAAAGCAVARESHDKQAVEPRAQNGDTSAADSGGQLPDAGSSKDERPDAAADSGAEPSCAVDCDPASETLADYCDLRGARCPASLEQARARSCKLGVPLPAQPTTSFALQQRVSLGNSCGGTSLRMRYSYGSVEYHFGADAELRAVTTQTGSAGGPCDATSYHYGDPQCAASGKGKNIECDP
jgi:hypothetical protein